MVSIRTGPELLAEGDINHFACCSQNATECTSAVVRLIWGMALLGDATNGARTCESTSGKYQERGFLGD